MLEKYNNGLLADLTEIPVGKNLQDVNRKADTRMKAVVHVIPAVRVHDVHIIVIAPAHWPRRAESEVVAAISETVTVVVSAIHVEAVPAAETAVVMRVVDPAVAAAIATAVLRRRM